jgi:rod shape-determining protein MreD
MSDALEALMPDHDVSAAEVKERRVIAPAIWMLVVAIVIQSVLPAVSLWSAPPAVPDLMIVVVCAIAVKRGVLAGALAGFTGGFLVELLGPGGSLGVIAFGAVLIGAWCGRFAESGGRMTWWMFTSIAAAAGGLVPLWYGLVDTLRGVGLPLDVLIPTIAVPHLTLAAIMAPLVWWVARRLLGAPQVVEPGMMRR